MLRQVLPQGSWLPPGPAGFCLGVQTLLGLASETQARLQAEPQAHKPKSYPFPHPP